MASKGKGIQSSTSSTVPNQLSHDSLDHEQLSDHEIGANQLGSSAGVEGQPPRQKRKYWLVQVRSMLFSLIFILFIQMLFHVLVYLVSIKWLTHSLSR